MPEAGEHTRRYGRAEVFAGVLALAVADAVVVGAQRAFSVLMVGAGRKAGQMCSAVFVAGRHPDDVLKHELSDIHLRLRLVPDPVVERESRSVSAPVLIG